MSLQNATNISNPSHLRELCVHSGLDIGNGDLVWVLVGKVEGDCGLALGLDGDGHHDAVCKVEYDVGPQKSEVHYPLVHGYAVSRSTGHLASWDKWQLNLGLNILSQSPSGRLEPEPEFRKRPIHHLTSIHRRPTTFIRNVDVPQRSIGCAPIGLTVLHRLDVKVGLELGATVRYGSAGFADERRPAGINGEDGVVRVRNSHDEGSGRCRGQALYWKRLPPSQRKFFLFNQP